MTSWHIDVEEFEQPGNYLIVRFYFLLEEEHDHLVYFLNCLVDDVFLYRPKWLKFRWDDLCWGVLFCAESRYAVIVLPFVFFCHAALLFHYSW